MQGRMHTFDVLSQSIKESKKTIWFHCASLGEYEQGFPVFKALRSNYKDYTIVLSFFSPSGFENKKNTPIADAVVYLPLDTKKNSKKFIELLKPELIVFVKYDIWPNYLKEIKNRNLRAILISASFRDTQVYFKNYGSFFKDALFAFEHIFTQNDTSKIILNSIGYNNVTVSGDTRFDRVIQQIKRNNTLDFVKAFKANKRCVVVGSSWPADEMLFINFINNTANTAVKYIVAPHNINNDKINSFISKLNVKTIRYSDRIDNTLEGYDVLVIDTIGLLSKIYSYADIAYVGGAMGKTGLHNILEPAVFGIPIIIGCNYQKFPEAQALINNGGVFSVKKQKQFNTLLANLIEKRAEGRVLGKKNKMFVTKNSGAVIQILEYLRI